jgi:hypothetical protein
MLREKELHDKAESESSDGNEKLPAEHVMDDVVLQPATMAVPTANAPVLLAPLSLSTSMESGSSNPGSTEIPAASMEHSDAEKEPEIPKASMQHSAAEKEPERPAEAKGEINAVAAIPSEPLQVPEVSEPQPYSRICVFVPDSMPAQQVRRPSSLPLLL